MSACPADPFDVNQDSFRQKRKSAFEQDAENVEKTQRSITPHSSHNKEPTLKESVVVKRLATYCLLGQIQTSKCSQFSSLKTAQCWARIHFDYDYSPALNSIGANAVVKQIKIN
jgi:hypothetical protein